MNLFAILQNDSCCLDVHRADFDAGLDRYTFCECSVDQLLVELGLMQELEKNFTSDCSY